MNTPRSGQGGVMLLEAMIGILIFSLGVLALVAMQAVSTSNVSNARYRTEAAFLANEIISQAWVDRGTNLSNVNSYVYSGGGGGGAVADWVAKVKALMPASDTYEPRITVSVVPGVAAREIAVTIFWRAPDAVTTSNFMAIGYISDP